jgi:hypothetical protein
MAVTTEKSDQITNVEATPPVLEDTTSLHGRHRIAYFTHTQVAVGDANSLVEVVQLPAGRVRVLFSESLIEHNWVTATIDMSVGWDAYVDQDGVAVVADPNGLDVAIDVEVAGVFVPGSAVAAGTAKTMLFESRGGVTITVQAIAAALAVGDTVNGYLTYVLD